MVAFPGEGDLTELVHARVTPLDVGLSAIVPRHRATSTPARQRQIYLKLQCFIEPREPRESQS